MKKNSLTHKKIQQDDPESYVSADNTSSTITIKVKTPIRVMVDMLLDELVIVG